MGIETKLLLACLLLLGTALVHAVLRVSGAWYEHHVTRHDLVAESKRRRYEYLKALADRDRALMEAEEAEHQATVTLEEEDEQVYAKAA